MFLPLVLITYITSYLRNKNQMRVVLQRAVNAEIVFFDPDREEWKSKGMIKSGLVVLLGIEHEDTEEDIDYLLRKTINMRIFNDENGRMNLSLEDVGGGIAIVSQFTLHALTKKGNRPSFIKAAEPDKALYLYGEFVKRAGLHIGKLISGEFGAHMRVRFTNEGPVTIILDSKQRDI